MQISPDELLAEAGRMALELRLKDRAIAALERRLADLENANAAPEEPAADAP